MGEVYLALDSQLDRPVALKILPAPDGRSIWYVNTGEGTANLCSQSIDGGPPKQPTKFADNDLGIFNFSRDGKPMAFTRVTVRSDVVLISDFR